MLMKTTSPVTGPGVEGDQVRSISVGDEAETARSAGMRTAAITSPERTLESAQRALAETQQTVSHVDQFVTDNREGLDETLTDLRRSTQNLRELTQSVKERPWTLLRTAPVSEKPGLESSTSKEPRR